MLKGIEDEGGRVWVWCEYNRDPCVCKVGPCADCTLALMLYLSYKTLTNCKHSEKVNELVANVREDPDLNPPSINQKAKAIGVK